MRRTMRIRPLTAVGVLSVSALVFTACGSSSNSSGPSAQAGAPKPAERISDFAKRFAAAAATGQCTRLQAVDSAFFSKNACGALLPQVYNLKVLGSASYGTGGVIDVTEPQSGPKGGPRGVTFVVTAGHKNGKWAILDGYADNRPTVGTTAKDTRGFESALNGAIAALRKKDCAAFIKYAFTATNGPSACTQPFGSAVAKALTADPAAVPASQGGNATYRFYSITLKSSSRHPRPTYLIWPVAKNTPGPGVTFPYAALPPR